MRTNVTSLACAYRNTLQLGDGHAVTGWLPDTEDWASPNLGEDEPFGQIDGGTYFTLPHPVWSFYLQRVCNHCTYPAVMRMHQMMASKGLMSMGVPMS